MYAGVYSKPDTDFYDALGSASSHAHLSAANNPNLTAKDESYLASCSYGRQRQRLTAPTEYLRKECIHHIELEKNYVNQVQISVCMSLA